MTAIMSTINRRHFLRLSLAAAGMSLLAACGGQAASSAPASPSPAAAKPPAPASVSAKPAASAGVASAPASSKPSVAASPATPVPSGVEVLKIATVGSISDAGFYLADDRGYLKEAGLGIDYQRLQSGPQMVPFLATGQLDVAGGSVSGALFSAIQRGVALRIVGDKGSNEPGFTFAYVLVRKDLADSGQIKGPADLKGRKVAISSTDNSGEYLVDRVMKTVGLSIKDVDTPILGYPDQGAGLANKAIDAGQEIEPFATQWVAKGLASFMADKDKFSGFQAAVVMYGPKFVQDRPDVGKKLMVAYMKGVRDYTLAFSKGKDKEDVIKSLLSHTTVKDRTLYDRLGLPGLNPNGLANDQDIAAQQDFFFARGYQKAKLDLKPVLDHQFVNYALDKLGKFSG